MAQWNSYPNQTGAGTATTDELGIWDVNAGTFENITVAELQNFFEAQVWTWTANINANGGLDVTGDITVTGTVDSRNIASDGLKLDGIAEGAEVNPALISQAEAETGTATTERIFSALRVAQAISAQSTSTLIYDIIATPDWNYSKTDGTGSADQPQYMYWTNGSLILRATLTWGSSGGADGNPTVIVWDYNDGGGYAGVGTETMAYDTSGNLVTTTWT